MIIDNYTTYVTDPKLRTGLAKLTSCYNDECDYLISWPGRLGDCIWSDYQKLRLGSYVFVIGWCYNNPNFVNGSHINDKNLHPIVMSDGGFYVMKSRDLYHWQRDLTFVT